MANELYTRTNQKLFFASRALQDWREACSSEAINAPALQQGACESALFHLHGALLALCHEVAGFYRLPNASATHVSRLLDQQLLAEKPSPELALLAERAAEQGGWIGQLRKAYADLSRPPKPEKSSDKSADNLIIAVAVDDGEPELTPDLLESWLRALKDLALHCRAGMSEW